MPCYLRQVFAGLIVCLMIAGPWAYAHWRKENLRNTHVVRAGVLYRSGQLSLAGLKRMVHDYGIRSVVTLRYADNPADEPPDRAEENFCQANQIHHFRLPHKAWWAEGEIPADANVARFHEIMGNPEHYPVLVHCFAGIHRTGAYCAIFRMEYDGWSSERAIEEMRAIGYEQIDEHNDVRAYLRNYGRRGLALPAKE